MINLRRCIIEYLEFIKSNESIGDKLFFGFAIMFYGSLGILTRLFIGALILSQIKS